MGITESGNTDHGTAWLNFYVPQFWWKIPLLGGISVFLNPSERDPRWVGTLGGSVRMMDQCGWAKVLLLFSSFLLNFETSCAVF